MAAILDIPEVQARLSRLSVDEYHRLDEFNENGRRTELIRGLVIEKMARSPVDRIITSLLHKLLQRQLPEGSSVWLKQPLTGSYQQRLVFGLEEVIECASLPVIKIPVRDLFEGR
jgi:hypothetical protein